MSYYSDPTAAKALGGINREFSRLEKKAKRLCKQLKEGRITQADIDKAQAQFQGIYRHVLNHALKKMLVEKETPPTEGSADILFDGSLKICDKLLTVDQQQIHRNDHDHRQHIPVFIRHQGPEQPKHRIFRS